MGTNTWRTHGGRRPSTSDKHLIGPAQFPAYYWRRSSAAERSNRTSDRSSQTRKRTPRARCTAPTQARTLTGQIPTVPDGYPETSRYDSILWVDVFFIRCLSHVLDIPPLISHTRLKRTRKEKNRPFRPPPLSLLSLSFTTVTGFSTQYVYVHTHVQIGRAHV